jgi:exodeoxyribonuclease V alpha subunit
MSAPLTDIFRGLVQIRHIRAGNSIEGGAIFAGYHVDERGKELATPYVVVNASRKLLPRGGVFVAEWECWHVAGPATERIIQQDKYTRKELYVEATEMYMVQPNGDLLLKYLTESPKFRGTGVGPVKFRNLWSRYGQDLIAILDAGHSEKLIGDGLLTSEAAVKLMDVWQEHAPGRFISFLQCNHFPVKLGARVVNFYGKESESKMNDDPYRLLAFGAKWKDVDALAQRVFGVMPDDERRLVGAVEAILAKQFKGKHTATPVYIIKKDLAMYLRVDGDKERTAQLVNRALEVGNSNGAFVKTQDGKLYHRLGTLLMEKLVADRIATMIREPDNSPSIFMAELNSDRVEELICQYEEKERKQPGKETFALNNEQRLAVSVSLMNRFTVVTGGAGTGKTTVLKCLYFALDALGYSVIQMALSGKAAKRMNEATGRKAMTIAGFLRKAQDLIEEHGQNTYLVIDEASMLDLQTTFRIFSCLPKHVRMVLVGDPHQLPPIGAGLIFQTLVAMSGVPQVELKVVKRQEDSTGIPMFAFEIRNHRWSTPDCSGVRFVDSGNLGIKTKMLELFVEAPESTQILCAVKHCAMSGVEAVNQDCQKLHNAAGKPIRVRDMNGNLSPMPFREWDRIIFTKNDRDRGTMNGSFATIIDAFDQEDGDDNPIIGNALLESDKSEEEVVPIYLSDLDYHDPGIMLGYATTVHKAQGSQWPRVIIPIKENRLGRSIIMDCTWVYTAITRGEKEVILVGDQRTIENIVKAHSRAHERCVGFGKILEEML